MVAKAVCLPPDRVPLTVYAENTYESNQQRTEMLKDGTGLWLISPESPLYRSANVVPVTYWGLLSNVFSAHGYILCSQALLIRYKYKHQWHGYCTTCMVAAVIAQVT